MQCNHNIYSTSCLVSLLDEMSAGCDPDFDAAYEELEREFAELRLHFGNQ
jgi:hypothetical protein